MSKIIIVILALNSSFIKFAKANDSLHYCISAEPQYLFNYGIKIGFEKRIFPNNLWIGIHPEFYLSEMYSKNYTYGPNSNMVNGLSRYGLDGGSDSIKGLGLTISGKYFFNNKKQYSGFYTQLRLTYRYLYISFNDYIWKPYQENNFTYYDLIPVGGYVKINQIDNSCGIGYSLRLGRHIRADLFAGAGYRWVGSWSNLDEYRIFKRSTFDFQYSGWHPVIEFQLGYGFR